MGLTLIEAAKYETRLEHLAVIKTFAEGELLSWLPLMNIAGGGLFYSIEKELPSVGFRAVNEGYKQSYGVVDPPVRSRAPLWRRRRCGPFDRGPAGPRSPGCTDRDEGAIDAADAGGGPDQR